MDEDDLYYYTAWNKYANEQAYEAPAEPGALLRIDPTTVETHNQELDLQWGLGRVQAGDWDRPEHCHPIDETDTYRGLVEHFEEGKNWEKTVLYQRARDAIEDGKHWRGYETLDAFREIRCAYLDDLYRSIERDGYRPNRDASHEKPDTDNPFEDAYVHHVEPLVVIGRDGRLSLTEGFHRLIIGRIQGLDEIPVQVLCRHKLWQHIRDQLATETDSTASGLDVDHSHPDLEIFSDQHS